MRKVILSLKWGEPLNLSFNTHNLIIKINLLMPDFVASQFVSHD